MKTRQSCDRTAKVSHSRWLAYATASAATALAGSHSAEASIHYSGLLHKDFPGMQYKAKTFQLDQPGDSFAFTHFARYPGIAYFNIFGIASGGVRALVGFQYYVSKLIFGENISSGPFLPGDYINLMAFGRSHGQWTDPGLGYVGFRFNSGAGLQYGWARVRMGGSENNNNGFELLGYAYADPGEPIRAGQRSSDEQAPDQGSTDEQGPDEGSLGGLALGAVGLLVWRKNRSRTAR